MGFAIVSLDDINLIIFKEVLVPCTRFSNLPQYKALAISDLHIVGEPKEAGEIEIRYGTYEKFKNKGLLTEIVSGINGWAKQQI